MSENTSAIVPWTGKTTATTTEIATTVPVPVLDFVVVDASEDLQPVNPVQERALWFCGWDDPLNKILKSLLKHVLPAPFANLVPDLPPGVAAMCASRAYEAFCSTKSDVSNAITDVPEMLAIKP